MEILEHIALAPRTTMKIGGPARYFCEATSISEIAESVAFAKERQLPLFVLGGGSNLLVSDRGFGGLVMRVAITDVRVIKDGNEIFFTVGAGHVWDKIVAIAVSENAWGIENLSAIPGTVGGAVVQNIGAFGSEVKDVVHQVDVYDPRIASLRTLTNAECRFGYRESIWKHEGKDLIVTSVTFRLSAAPKPNISYKDLTDYFLAKGNTGPTLGDIRTAVIAVRAAKFPDLSLYGTAGSFFKNPVVTADVATEFLSRFPSAPHYDAGEGMVKLSAAWIIDHVLHMRGAREGNVGCWDAQALVITNYGNANACEVHVFVRMIQKKIA